MVRSGRNFLLTVSEQTRPRSSSEHVFRSDLCTGVAAHTSSRQSPHVQCLTPNTVFPYLKSFEIAQDFELAWCPNNALTS